MKAVFLDIDGVVQPYNSEIRYREFPNAKRIITELSEKHQIDYSKYHVYDVLAAYYDWNKNAIQRIKTVLDATDSKLIIASNWRSIYEPNKMHDLLEIHDLGSYWYADNIIIVNKFRFMNNFRTYDKIRRDEIKDSLKRYPITNFVIVDDMWQLASYFPKNIVVTKNYMTEEDMNKCIKILKKEAA